MSGPIIRKYGFPNHEQIFGKRPLEHGAEAGAEAEDVKPAGEKAEKAPDKKGKPKPKKK